MSDEQPFLLFAGKNHYAAGGWDDFQGAYGLMGDACAALQALPADLFEWAHIVDLRVQRVVVMDSRDKGQPWGGLLFLEGATPQR